MADQTNAEVSDERLREAWPLCGYAPGNYSCRCHTCDKQFVGDKRATTCLECAVIETKVAINRRSVTSQASEGEVATLRSIIAKCATALGNGAFIDPERASVEFMSNLPAEIEAVVASKRVERLETALTKTFDEWSAEDGDVVWWCWRDGEWLGEAAYIGTPLDLGQTVEIEFRTHQGEFIHSHMVGGWPGYHTHWTPHPTRPQALQGGRS